MTPDELEAIEATYQEVNASPMEPAYICAAVPGVGFVEVSGGVFVVNARAGTQQEKDSVMNWLRSQCTPPPS